MTYNTMYYYYYYVCMYSVYKVDYRERTAPKMYKDRKNDLRFISAKNKKMR